MKIEQMLFGISIHL